MTEKCGCGDVESHVEEIASLFRAGSKAAKIADRIGHPNSGDSVRKWLQRSIIETDNRSTFISMKDHAEALFGAIKGVGRVEDRDTLDALADLFIVLRGQDGVRRRVLE